MISTNVYFIYFSTLIRNLKIYIMKKITFVVLLIANFGYSQYSMEQFVSHPGTSSGDPKYFTPFNNLIYYNATSGPFSTNTELWRTDGTQAGTFQAADISLGSGSSNPGNFIEFNGYLYFTAGDFYTTGTELYRTNGTTTELFKEFRPGAAGGFEFVSHQFVILNNKLYFFAKEDENGYDLWRTDGTQSGTEKMVELNISNPGQKDSFLEVNGELFFLMDEPFDTVIGHELYKYNETTNTVSLVRDILNTPNNNQHISYLTKFDNKLFFSANNGSVQTLYVSDGTYAGTTPIIPTSALVNYSKPQKLQVFNNELYFAGTLGIGNGADLLKCKKIISGNPNIDLGYDIDIVYNFNPTGNNNLNPFAYIYYEVGLPAFTAFNNELYFAAREQSAPNNGENYQIYKTNGTTTQIAFAIAATVAGPDQAIYNITVFNGKLIFMMKGVGMPQTQLWEANPTTNTVTRLTNYYGTYDLPQTILPNIAPFIYNNNFYFRAGSINEGVELWKLSDSSLSAIDFEEKTIIIYPNPTKGIINILSENATNFKTEVFDLLGKKVAQFENQNSIDISRLNQGIYIIKTTDLQTNKTNVQKIIKE